MAGLGSGAGRVIGGFIKPTFNVKAIENAFEEFANEVDEKVFNMLAKMGEDFVDAARSTDTYKNRTSNLRNSIGYRIYLNGVDKLSDFTASGTHEEAKSEAIQSCDQLAIKYPKGWVLIGVAGMNYALYVEAKGYDVITGSAPLDSQFKQYMEDIKSSI